MAVTDIARRVYNHSWKLDPIIRSLLDTDFYKLLMLQMIWKKYPDVDVTFSLINRSKNIKLAQEFPIEALRDQLDHARSLTFTKKELIWLSGNQFYQQTQIFHKDFLLWLKDFQLPEYELYEKDGNYILNFHGKWAYSSMWEIPALSIINELRGRALTADLKLFSLDIAYSRAKAKVWDKLLRLAKLPNLKIADFGTRRRHSFLWQAWCVAALKEGLGEAFTGSSNTLLAMNSDLDAIGTNAHELPMVLTALAQTDEEKLLAPYKVLQDWSSFYQGNLMVALPDTYGTTSFLKYAPDWLADWRGFRPDSAPPISGGDMLINWWRQQGKDPKEKLLVFSDSLDVEAIEKSYHYFEGKVQMAFGWGTNLTNDFSNCFPNLTDPINAISLVCKVTKVNDMDAVKLSDNPAKATGQSDEIERYKKIFNYQPLI